MAIGFVLIDVEPGKEREVYEALIKVEDVKELHPLFGEHDLIAKVEAGSFDELSDVVVRRIRGQDGVVETRTLTGARF